MQFLSKLKLSYLIMILVFIPIASMFFFSTNIVLDATNKKRSVQSLSQLTSLAVLLGSLVHEQQKERGATAVFLGSGGSKFSFELTEQRKQTDLKRSELVLFLSKLSDEKYGEDYASKISAVTVELQKMGGVREAVDGQQISVPIAVKYYTELNGKSLELISFMSKLSSDPVIVSQIVGFASFLQAKERAGLERAMGAVGLSAGKFNSEVFNKFKILIASQDTYGQVFLTYGSKSQIAAFRAMEVSPVAQEVQRMRDVILFGGLSGDLQNITSKYWFEEITKKINTLKEFETQLSRDLLVALAVLEKAASRKQLLTIIEMLIVMFFVTGLSFMIIRHITSSLKQITSSMTDLAAGNLDIDLPAAQQNEIGKMTQALVIFKENAVKKTNLETERETERQQAEEEKRVMMHKLAEEFDVNVGGIVENVASASTELQATAESMSGIAQNTSNMSAAVSAASEEASTNVQTVASAAEEMSNSISEINNRVTEASSAIQTAVCGIADTGEQMQNLAKTADNISDVVKLISDIAEQTNLLALNATIESARAGEAGRGFAVVASEVKALASQTAKATEGISAQVEEIQKATKEAVVSMEHIGKSIQAVDETSAAIAASMEEQGAATQEIARNVQEAASGTEEVSRNIVGVNQASGEAGAAAEQVTSAASELSQQAEMLKGEVGKFISQVRAG